MRAIFHLSASALALFALMACSPPRTMAPAAVNPTPPMPEDGAEAALVAPGPLPGFTGLWYVSAVFPTAAAGASVADPHLGAALVIDAAEVSDVNGQRCVTPAFQADKMDAQASGLTFAPAGDWDRLKVTCDGKSFATYILMPAPQTLKGAGAGLPAPANGLLQQRPEGLYFLEQAGPILHRLPDTLLEEQTDVAQHAAPALEAAMPEPELKEQATASAPPVELAPKVVAAAPAPVPEGPVAAQTESAPATAAKVTAAGSGTLPAPGTAVHLASYKGESAAKRGWKLLLGEYDELDLLSPLYVAVDVPGKGAIIRLYAIGAEKAELTRICAALMAKKAYCTLNP